MDTILHDALHEARAALTHPRDGWFDDRCNLALTKINAALKAAPLAAQPDERAAFEAWWVKMDLRNTYTRDVCWQAWQAARAAPVEPAPAPDGWQPIETAPKVDGAKLLLWWSGRVIWGSWLDNSKTERPWSGWRAPSLEPTTGQPSHWMPLPARPAAQEQTK